MATGDVFAVKFKMFYDQQECLPGIYLIEGGGGGAGNPLVNCGLAVLAALGTTPIDDFSANLRFDGVIVSDIQPATGRTQEVLYTTPASGGVGEDNPLPPQDSGLISWTTDVKPIKGAYAADSRTYLPGVPETGQISGFLTAPFIDSLSAFASLLFDVFVTDGTAYQMHSVSFTPHSKPRTIRATNPITAFSIPHIISIQRPRRPGRGI